MNNRKILKTTMAMLLALPLLSSCTRNISSSNYSANSIGEAMMSYQGTIISARKVTSQEGDKLTDNVAGMAVGGLTGGVAGNMIGKGHGNLAATAGGALLGATAGAFAQQYLSSQEAMEYTVKLTNGQIMTVVQGLDNPLSVGQRVIVQVSQQGGRSRVIPDASPQDVQPLAKESTVVVHKAAR